MGRGRSVWRRIYPALILSVMFGCWQFRVRPAGSAHLQETLNQPRDAVFDAALSEAHQMNLEVKVIEKASGLLRFETVRLSPDQMDDYCIYPLESTGCRQLPTSFPGAAAENEGAWGLMSITVLVSATGADSSMIDIRADGTTTITVRRVTREYTVDSKGVIEQQLLEAVKKRLNA